ncbi:MAG: hypothetical protein ABI831_01930 [Betaproteobacteria bacterium]
MATTAATAGGELPTQFSSTGKVRNNAFTIKGSAAQVLALEKPDQPHRDGTFGNPNVHPAAGPIAGRVGAAAVLGLLNPLASLLPLIDPGGAEDADCAGLTEQANDNVSTRAAPNKPRPKGTAT